MTLDEALFQRKSVRTFRDDPLTLEEVSSLLHAAGGKTVDGTSGPTRAYPSAGGLYPLDIYLAAGNVTGLASGVYEYQWRDHSLRKISEGDVRTPLMRSALNQTPIGHAPASIVLAARFERTTSRYGVRGDRYVLMDTGAALQNVQLKATDLGLGSVVIGAFDDAAVQEVLRISSSPLVVMPVGRLR